MGLIFGRIPFLKQSVDRLIKLGISRQMVDKLVIGMVTLNTTAALTAQTGQKVTPEQVQAKTQQLLKALGIDPSKQQRLSPQQQKASEALMNITQGVFSKILTSIIHDPIISETAEVVIKSTMKTVTAPVTEQPLTHAELDRAVREGIEPTQKELESLKGRIVRHEDLGAPELKALQNEAQVRLDTLRKAREEAAQQPVQARIWSWLSWLTSAS